MARKTGNKLGTTLVGIAALALLLVVASRVTDIIFLFFISVLLAVYLVALTDWIQTVSRIPRGGSLLVSVVFTLVALVGVAAVILPPVVVQA